MVVEQWEVDRCRPYASNARIVSVKAVDKVAQSIEQFGFRQPIVVDVDGVVIIGHTRLMAAKQLKLGTVPVHVATGLDPAQVKALRLADNRTHEETAWDEPLLGAEMLNLQSAGLDLALTGFDSVEIDKLLRPMMAATEEEIGLVDPPSDPVSRPGDLWVLGGHRLLCGDATNAEDVRLVMHSQLADLVITDPPYGVAIAGRTGTHGVSSMDARAKNGKSIRNDNLSLEDLTEFLRKALTNTRNCTHGGSCWYVFSPHSPMGLATAIVLHDLEIWRHSLVWVKDSLVMGRMDYHYRHEPIYYGWTPGAPHAAVPTRDQDTVWEFPRPKKSPEHPTMKPIALIERAVRNSSKRGQAVLDPFGGSGSTLIACENTGREAMLIEIDPRYCDVIIQRWQTLTGGAATLRGESFEVLSGRIKNQTSGA